MIGYHPIPIRLGLDLTITGMSGFMLPWQSWGASGLVGHLPGQPEQRQLVVGYEWPIQHFIPLGTVKKGDLENYHLSRYCTDVLLATGALPYVGITPGANPPDFIATADPEGQLGIDCTQFTVPSRRPANSLFGVVRSAILQEPRERFAHLAACAVYMWFGDETVGFLPAPGPKEKAKVEAIVSALADYQVDRERMLGPLGAPLPDRLPDHGLDQTVPGTTFYALPMMGAVPATPFFMRTGFELGMVFSTTHDAASVEGEIGRLVEKHDKPGIDHLLITAGGPNRDGFVFPTEEYLISLFAGPSLALPTTQHLSEVTLHLWANGTIIELLPAYREIVTVHPGGIQIPHLRGPA